MAEVTMICVDNSGDLCPGIRGPGLMNAQKKAIELYCSEKFKAHPDHTVGFTTMGKVDLYCEPSRDLNYILSKLRGLHFAGSLYLHKCLTLALRGLDSSGLRNKRLLMFAGGQLNTTMPVLENLASVLRDNSISVDVVNFGLQDPAKHEHLQEFVEEVNIVDGKSRYLHAPAGSRYSLSQNLSSSPIMPHVVVEGSRAKKPSLGKKKDHHFVFSAEELDSRAPSLVSLSLGWRPLRPECRILSR